VTIFLFHLPCSGVSFSASLSPTRDSARWPPGCDGAVPEVAQTHPHSCSCLEASSLCPTSPSGRPGPATHTETENKDNVN